MNSFGLIDFLDIAGRTHFQMLLFERITPNQNGGIVEAKLVSPVIRETFDHAFELRDGRLDGAFVRCPEAPPALRWMFGEMLAAFDAFGAIQAACTRGDGPDCLRAAFRYADVTGDGQLTVAEVSRVLRALGFLVGYLSQPNAIVPVKDLTVPIAIAGLAGPYVVRSLVEGMDYDDNGALSLEELLQDRGDVAGLAAAAAAAEPAAVQAMLGAALAALPGLFKLLPF